MSEKMVITNKIVDEVCKGRKMNDVLAETYAKEIEDKKKENKIFENMSPINMILQEAGITKASTLRDIVDSAVITTQGGGDWLLPAYIDTRLSETVDKNNILNYVVGNTVNESSRTVEQAYLDMTTEENKKAAKKSRVAEGADLPLAKISIGESAIRLYKHGRAVERTYESMMLMRVDLFNKTLDMIANDVANQELESAIEVALNGDGNNNAAKSLGTTATKNIVTPDELVDALIDYYNATKLPATTIVAGDALYKNLYKMMYPTNENMGASSKFTFNTPQIPGGSVNLIYAGTDIKKGADNAIMLLNPNVLTKHLLTGSSIREYQKFILNQTELGTISEIAGFSKPINDGVKLLVSHS